MSGPNDDEIKGKLKNVKGVIKEKIGRATGDGDLEAEGLGDRAGGKVQEGFGKARRKAGDVIKDIGKKIGK